MRDPVSEDLAFIPCGQVHLAGVLASPKHPNGIAALIPWGAGAYPSSGRNQMRTRLARSLANQGFHALRFDYQGVGESDGEYRHPSLSAPYVEEVIAACNWLSSQGLRRQVIVGNCFGGWSSLMAAPSIPGLLGIALINSPVRRDHKQLAADRPWRWWARRVRRLNISKLRDAGRRKLYIRMLSTKVSASLQHELTDSRFRGAIEGLVDRGVPIMMVYGRRGGFTRDFEAELDRGLDQLIESASAPTRVIIVDQQLEGYRSLEAQEVVIDVVSSWLQELVRLPARS